MERSVLKKFIHVDLEPESIDSWDLKVNSLTNFTTIVIQWLWWSWWTTLSLDCEDHLLETFAIEADVSVSQHKHVKFQLDY